MSKMKSHEDQGLRYKAADWMLAEVFGCLEVERGFESGGSDEHWQARRGIKSV